MLREIETTHTQKDAPRTVLLGLVVHTAADGLAVGVAHMSESWNLALAIGMAMVLHKGPVAIGLVTYLLSQGCSRADIWQVRHFTMFSVTVHNAQNRFVHSQSRSLPLHASIWVRGVVWRGGLRAATVRAPLCRICSSSASLLL